MSCLPFPSILRFHQLTLDCVNCLTSLALAQEIASDRDRFRPKSVRNRRAHNRYSSRDVKYLGTVARVEIPKLYRTLQAVDDLPGWLGANGPERGLRSSTLQGGSFHEAIWNLGAVVTMAFIEAVGYPKTQNRGLNALLADMLSHLEQRECRQFYVSAAKLINSEDLRGSLEPLEIEYRFAESLADRSPELLTLCDSSENEAIIIARLMRMAFAAIAEERDRRRCGGADGVATEPYPWGSDDLIMTAKQNCESLRKLDDAKEGSELSRASRAARRCCYALSVLSTAVRRDDPELLARGFNELLGDFSRSRQELCELWDTVGNEFAMVASGLTTACELHASSSHELVALLLEFVVKTVCETLFEHDPDGHGTVGELIVAHGRAVLTAIDFLQHVPDCTLLRDLVGEYERAEAARRVHACTPKGPNRKAATANEDRDKWIYAETCKLTKYSKIISDLGAKTEWESIDSISGVKAAAKRYARRHQLPMPPVRQPGHPSSGETER